jgi:hypothetical protein
MAMLPLLIIYQQTLMATAFWLLQVPQIAGWLRLIPQAKQQNLLSKAKEDEYAQRDHPPLPKKKIF